MRIGLNVLCMSPQYKGGVYSFVFGLIDGFAQVGAAHEFVLFVTPYNREMFQKYETRQNFRFVEIDQTNHSSVRRRLDRLPMQVRCRLPSDLLNWYFSKPYAEILTEAADVHFVPFCPPQLFPFPEGPTVYAIHDIQHVHFPDFFTQDQRLERKINFAQCVRKGAVIQASSQYMRRDFIEHLDGLDDDRVVVIPEGVDIEFFQLPRAIDEVRTRYHLPEAFLFLPAQLWHHKNHITLLRALARLREREIEIPVVLTGHRYEASQGIFDFIEQSGLAQQLFYLGVIPFEDVVALYQAARFLVMPSLYESSSIPILEAAAAGTAIIASRIPPNEEFAANLAMQMFAPTDDAELADLLAVSWTKDFGHQVAANRKNIHKFSWSNAARQYVELFKSLSPHDRQ